MVSTLTQTSTPQATENGWTTHWEYAGGKIPGMTSRWPSRSVPARSSRRKGTEPIQENGSQQETSMQTIKMLSRKPPSYAKLDCSKEAAPRLAVFFKQSSPTWAATITLLPAKPLGRQQWWQHTTALLLLGAQRSWDPKGDSWHFSPSMKHYSCLVLEKLSFLK